MIRTEEYKLRRTDIQSIIRIGCSILLVLLCSFTMNATVVTFTGGVDMTWDDAGNWDTGIPTVADSVCIPAGFNVVIDMPGAEAKFIKIAGQASLTVNSGGELTVFNDFDGNGMKLEFGSSFTIDSGGKVEIIDTDENGLKLCGANLTIGDSLILEYIGDDGIDIDSSSTIEILTTGVLATRGSQPIEEDFIDIDENSGLTTINNRGTIDVDMDDHGDEVFDFDDGCNFTNFATGTLDIKDGDDNVFDINDGDVCIYNYGVMDFDEAGDDGFDLEDGGKFINYLGATLTMNEMSDEGFDVSDDCRIENYGTITYESDNPSRSRSTEEGFEIRGTSTFLNDGTVDILNVEDEPAIEVRGDAKIENVNGIINISLDSSNFGYPAINIEEGASIINFECAIINITTTDSIHICDGGRFENRGIFTTEFTGVNTSFDQGILINTGVISTPTGSMNFIDNPIQNSGTINNAPIPAVTPLETGCSATPIPTLSEWSIICLSLIMLIVFVRATEKQLSFS